MFGSGTRLVSIDVAETKAYQVSQFEGFVPHSVTLDSFVAVSDMEGIHLKWTTRIEKNNHTGFRLWRAIKDKAGEYIVTLLKKERYFYITGCTTGQLVTAKTESSDSLISSAVSFSRESTCYSFTDISIIPEGTYYYMLEDIDKSGKKTFHCDAIAATTKGHGPDINLEAAKDYCRQAMGNGE